ncbi:hypothetical protein FDJ57_gp69 [Gordonia phage Sour]|uniref:Uncharacterized protein n=1 Tax=Gordonia phage Sour TaxID=2182349 RepID=A0A2U8UKY1_9CAUD|nr:hypothetical protein FDJ57_gp69 [Gordonia phage Sour]AWN04270.1 hypothetical protein PBI_SOUR_69 [Gordonia phage Sour]
MPSIPSEPPGFSLDQILVAPTPRRDGKVIVSPRLYAALVERHGEEQVAEAVMVYQR